MLKNQKKHQEAAEIKFHTKLLNLLRENKVKQTYKHLDGVIIGLTIVLVLIGLIMVYSATLLNNPFSMMRTQIVSVVIGIVAINILLVVPYELFENVWLIIIGMTVMIILLFFTWRYAEVISGATSWIQIFGFSFQPSELVKLLSILLVSWLINYSEREEILSLKTLPNRINIFMLLLLVIALLLIGFQPDFGMLAIIVGTVYLIFMLTKAKLWVNILSYTVIIVGYIALVSVGHIFGDWLVNSNFHFFERIAAFADPFTYPLTPGYQLIQGFLAFSRGGWFGVGLGKGIGKEGYLPAIETDFILAHIGEELGFVGVILVLMLLFALILVLYQRAASSQHMYRRSVIIGVASLLLVQVIINVGGVASILPLTGVTLPLISYGGTSMITTLTAIGLALRMIAEDRKNPKLNLVYSRKKGSVSYNEND